jgi:gluconate 2-dehydrogenase
MKPKVLVARWVFPDIVDRLREHFDVDDNPEDVSLTKDQLIARLKDKVGALTTGGDRIDGDILDANPQLRTIANIAVGYNNFDVPAFTKRGVLGTNTPDVLTETTADFGFALMMATARRVTEGERFLRDGQWKRWGVDMLTGGDVHGSTLGILGMGRIGRGIARRGAFGFGMNVIYHNRSKLEAKLEDECRATYVSKEKLLRDSDHLVIVMPYSPEAHHIIGAAEIALMKPTATLINVARGGLIDEAALVAALKANKIAAAGLDVFEGEPAVNPGLLEVPNVVLTPHIASASTATRRAMCNLAVDNLIAGLGFGPDAGKPPCPLNPEVLKR